MTAVAELLVEKPVTAQKKALLSIDIIRAIAALGVFFYHHHIGMLLARYTGLKFFKFIDAFGAGYAVPLFFLISGYCIHLSNLKYIRQKQKLPLKSYYIKRFRRIYPPYIFALLFSIAINYIFSINSLPTITDLIAHIFVLQGFSAPYFNTINLVLWTITIEVAFYVLYPVFYYIRSKYSLNQAMAVSLLISCVSIGYFSRYGNGSYPHYYFVLNLWFAWCCGAYIADLPAHDFKSIFNKKHILIYVFIAALFIFLNVSDRYGFPILAYQLKILIWTAPVAFIISKEWWFKQNTGLLLNVLRCIGVSSYSLYLLHMPLISLKSNFSAKLLSGYLQHATIIIGFLLIPLAAWASYLIFEKPFMGHKK